MSEMKHLLLVYHTKTGNTGMLADAAARGARHPEIGQIELRMLEASKAGPDDLLWADGILLGTPENFGYMSGAMKDFLDRTYYEVEGKLQPLPYALFVSAGNDGRGAVNAIARIAGGYPFVQVQEPIIVRGEITADDLARCEELGTLLAAGLETGIY
jgi:multimeric flavodoxin WrbA